MVNDLLFPILPREGKVPVKFENRVQKIGKITGIKELGEEERTEHDEERRVSAQQERQQHDHPTEHHHSMKGTQHDEITDNHSAAADSGEDGEAKEDEGKIRHLDIYI